MAAMKNHPSLTNLHMDEAGAFWLRLLPTHDGAGYQLLRVPTSSGPITERVHRIVWAIENGAEVPPGKVVRHLNDIKADNRPENLALGSQGDNVADAHRNGLKGGTSKLTNEQASEVRSRRLAGESLKSLAAEFSISVSRVCDLAKGRTKQI